MDFFVEQERKGDHKEVDLPKRYDLEWIAVGKKAGLTLAEMNELRIQDLADYVEIVFGKNKKEPRSATQEDIDRFFSL